ncbi:MAG: hypothetical protein E6Q73_03850 [Pseudorhodobacter sp.]|nr:MAG: hypothetical protein E6Q73_03850 [Pseudorhodobacter sp.]
MGWQSAPPCPLRPTRSPEPLFATAPPAPHVRALERRFTPAMPEPERAARVARWQRAVQATLSV